MLHSDARLTSGGLRAALWCVRVSAEEWVQSRASMRSPLFSFASSHGTYAGCAIGAERRQIYRRFSQGVHADVGVHGNQAGRRAGRQRTWAATPAAAAGWRRAAADSGCSGLAAHRGAISFIRTVRTTAASARTAESIRWGAPELLAGLRQPGPCVEQQLSVN